MSGLFLTIEGIEGVGKTTALKCIQAYFATIKQECVITREPGGTPIAEQIRLVLLANNAEEKMTSEAELLLMFAARAQHVSHFIIPNLQNGKVVVSDRFVDASYAYQGGGREIPIEQIKQLEKLTIGNLSPHATILLDAPSSIGLTRAKNRGPKDRIEQEKIEFFEKVRAIYLERAAADTKRFHVIDATQPLAVVHQKIEAVLAKLVADTISDK